MRTAEWFDGITFPRETEIACAQDFVDYVSYHPKEFWDVAIDFPDLTPPAHPIFLHGRAPELVNSEVHGLFRWPADRPRAWGVFFDRVDIRERWVGKHRIAVVDLSGPEPDEYVVDGEEAKRICRWNVVASMVEDAPVLGGWLVRPTARWRYLVDGEGALVFHRGHHYFGPKDKDADSAYLAKNCLPLLFPMMLALSAWNEGAAVIKQSVFTRKRRLNLLPGPFPAEGRQRRQDLAS